MEGIIEIKNLESRFGSTIVHQGLDLTVKQGEILGIVGGSGAGKTTLLREILMLQPYFAGQIKVFGHDLMAIGEGMANHVRQRWGMMFQQGALFSSLTVLENVSFPLLEFTDFQPDMIKQLALTKIQMAQFPLDAVNKFPAELSGGMLKRAAIARAIVMDPELLFLDEPTAGLDPQSASALDKLVLSLKSMLGLTIVIITHDLDTLWTVTDRVAFLGEKRVLAVDTMTALQTHQHPLIQDYFRGPRGRGHGN